MNRYVEPAIACILKANGEPCGGGVLVAPHLVATCAHVTAIAWGKKRDLAKPLDRPVEIAFPFRRNEAMEPLRRSARQVFWRPYVEGKGTDSDLVILKLADPFETGHVLLGDPSYHVGEPVECWGHHKGGIEGALISANLKAIRGDGWLQVSGDQANHYFVEEGASGAGIFLRGGERLLGLATGYDGDKFVDEGIAIGARWIELALKDLDAKATLLTALPQPTASPKPDSRTELRDCAAQMRQTLAENPPNPNHVRPEIIGLFVAVLGDVLDLLQRPPEQWTDADAEALLDLQRRMERTFTGEGGDLAREELNTPMLPRLGELLARLVDALGRADGPNAHLDNTMQAWLREARQIIQAAKDDSTIPDRAKPWLKALDRLFEEALEYREIALSALHRRADAIRAFRIDRLARIGRLSALLIGRRLDIAPPPSCFIETDLPFAPEMVVLPAGRFLMGSPESDKEASDSEKPQHEVVIERRFAMGRYPVTVGEYMAAVKAGGCPPPRWLEPGSEYHIETGTAGYYKKFGDALTGERFPIIGVSWQNAQSYVRWLNGQVGGGEGGPYRLPSEAEWEYACRAGMVTRYPWGDDWDKNKANGSVGGPGKPTEIGAYPANGFGLHDMIGNVFEWCADTWEGGYEEPRRQSPFQGKDSSYRVLRGGSWGSSPRDLRSANRGGYFPEGRYFYIGFRLSRTLTP